MKSRYDPEADAMYIKLKAGAVDHSRRLAANIIVDINKEGEIIGIEILFVKEKNPELLKEFKAETLLTT